MPHHHATAAFVLGALSLALASCGDSGGTKSQEAPPAPFAQDTFGKCAWEQVKGAQLSIWSYKCGPDAGNVRLVADETLPGFVLLQSSTEGETRTPAIRAFKKAAGAPLDAVLDQVRAASPGPHTATCTLTKHPAPEAGDKFQFMPDAAAAAEWDKYQNDGEGDVQPPCGALGPQFVGDSYFQILPGDPSTVVFVNMGSEIQIFDPKTLQAIKE